MPTSRWGGRLTAREALVDLGIARLAARIHELRRNGHPIEDRMINVPTRNGMTRVSEYYLQPQQASLDL